MADLKGRTVFITGSGGVLGSTYVRRMLAEGARVVASDLPGERADALVDRHGSDDNFRFRLQHCSIHFGCVRLWLRLWLRLWFWFRCLGTRLLCVI